jgi:hypothetical protein
MGAEGVWHSVVVCGDEVEFGVAWLGVCVVSIHRCIWQVISALAARVRGVSGAGIRWLAKKALMIQPLGWSMYLSGEVMLSRVYARSVQGATFTGVCRTLRVLC